MNNAKLSTAIALVLGGVSAAHAATGPTLAQCQSPSETLYIAGSSAAQNAFGVALNTADAFGGSEVTFSASNGNFKAYCGISANAALAPVGDPVVIHYRAEGGSVVGALPIVNNVSVKFLNLAGPSTAPTTGNLTPGTTYTLTTTGTSQSVGTTDGWGGTGNPSTLTSHTVEVGVTDVEPSQFSGSNYPTAYSTAVFGPQASASALGALPKTVLFDQVFGIFVNTSGFNGSTATGQALNLSKETYGAILSGTYTDWSQVPVSTFTNGVASAGVASSSPLAITRINREAGSGTRTGASIYFLGYNCGQTATSIVESGSKDYYATSDELAAIGATGGAVGYASIDQSATNVSIATLNGIVPSNLAAATGDYGWWYEAQLIKGSIISNGGSTIYGFLTTELASVNTVPHVKDILAVPGAGSPKNSLSVPVAPNTFGGATTPIYVNSYTHQSNSCSVPVQ